MAFWLSFCLRSLTDLMGNGKGGGGGGGGGGALNEEWIKREG